MITYEIKPGLKITVASNGAIIHADPFNALTTSQCCQMAIALMQAVMVETNQELMVMWEKAVHEQRKKP